VKALMVVKPHGEMVLDGTKTLIVQEDRLSDLIGKSVLLVEGDAAIGEVELKAPREITVKEFDGLRDQHQISDNERRRWWPDARKLNAHEFVFKAFDKPRRVARERGPRMVTGEVIFKTQEYYDLLKRVFGNALGKYTDQDLVQVHRLLHIFFNRKTGGEKVVIEGQPRSVEDIVNRHVLVVQEMGRRGFEHHEDEDELNRLSKPFMKQELAPVNPSGAGAGKPKARVEDIFKYFNQQIILHKGAVVFTGGVINNGESDNDLDVLARIPSIDELLRRLYFRLIRSLPEGHPLKESLHLIGNDPSGPFTSFIPAYDLALIPGDMKVIRMSQDEESLDIVKQRAASEKVKEEAQASLKDDVVKPMRFFLPMKPTKGAQPEQRQSIDNFISLFKEDDFPVYSSKKYDGARHVVFIKDTPAGTGIKIMSEDGEDNTSRFPGAVESFRDLKVGAGAVLDCEVELWDMDGKHFPREAVAAYAHSGDPAADSNIVFNVFDLLYLNGEDLHKKPLEERLRKLRSVGIRQSTTGDPDLKQRINLAPHFKAEDVAELKADTLKVTTTPGSEGNVAKKAGSVYYLDGNSREGWVKFHVSALLRGIVLDAIETKVPGTFNYDFGLAIEDEKVNPKDVAEVAGMEYLEVGKTFSTAIKADPGDVIEVEFETLNYTVDPEGFVTIGAWAPRVMKVVEEQPFTIAEALRAAADGGVLSLKEISPDGETIYKMEKSLSLGWDDAIEKQSDPYMVSPSEDVKYDYVCQHHYRGKSAHVDLRAENQDKKFLIGWTIADLIPDAIKNPVETLQEAKTQDAVNSNWKIDWKTGKFKDRETRSGNIVAAQLRAFEKAPEPVDWINVEGVTQPFPAPGSTKEHRGVFSIIDGGTIEYGAQKLDTHEYFLSGKLNGRLLIRRLARDTISEGIENALPPGVEEGSETTSTFWVAIQPEDQTPIVITKREVEKGWMPPDGVSALPDALRKKILPEYRYWEKKGDEARKVRDALVANLDSVLKAGEADYALQFHGFRTPGAKPVREGFTEWHWDFRVDKGGKTLDRFVLENNPLTSEMVSATFKQDEWKSGIRYQGNPEPGHPMNPTKASSATVSILDSGKLVILIDNPTFKKYDIRDGKMRGLWVAQRDDGKTPHWRFGKSQRVEAR